MTWIRTPTKREVAQAPQWWAEYESLNLESSIDLQGADLRQHLREMQFHINRLKFIGKKPTLSQQYEILLHSLSEKWANELLLIAHERRANQKPVTFEYCAEELMKVWVEENQDRIVREVMASFPTSYP